MSLFNFNKPLLCRKEITSDIQSLPSVWQVHWQIGQLKFSTFYTRLDQSCILWGLISAVIFITAQFIPISWCIQAVLWSVLTIIGTVCMVSLTWFRVRLERLKKVLYFWIILILVGLALTDLSIFLGWGNILMYLCPMWLGIIALGYLGNGLLMQSRTFIITAIMHLLSIFILPYVGPWQFVITGIVMGVSVLLLAEFRWDTRSTLDLNLLTPQQKHYI